MQALFFAMDIMQIEPSEFELIKYPERGISLYRCGNERYLLQVIAPAFKQKMFGKAGKITLTNSTFFSII